jgi:hypothetical protein
MATSIIGTGHDLPHGLVTNAELARRCVDSDPGRVGRGAVVSAKVWSAS